MPLTKKGRKIRAKMRSEYGSKKGDEVFYAMENSGKLKGVKAGRGKSKTKARKSKSKRGRG